MIYYIFFQWITNWINAKILTGNKKTSVKDVITMLTLGIPISLSFLYIGTSTVSIVFLSLFFILRAKIISIKKRLALTSMTLIITTLSDHLTSFLDNLIFSKTSTENILFHAITYMGFSIILSLLIRKTTKQIRNLINNNSYLQTIFPIICVLILCSYYGSIFLGFELGNNIEIIQLNLFFFIIYLLISLMAGYLYVKSLKMKYEEERKKAEYDSLQKYMLQIESQYTELRKFKHDYQNILSSLEDYIREKDYEKLDEYYFTKIKVVSQKIIKNDFSLENLSNVKVREIKSILAAKLMLAQAAEIDVTFEAKEHILDIPLDSLIFVRIIGILLDNAIEAISELGYGKLLVALFQQQKSITFIVQNTCSSDIPRVYLLKQAGFSTKGENRGLGLSTLSELVQQCANLSNETRIKENEFIQKIVIGG